MGPAEAAHEPAAEPEPTPLGTLLDSFVDIPASLRDDHNHRTPTVLSSGLPTRFWALLLPWLNFPPFSITSTNTLPLTYALTSALALNLALSLSSSALAPTSV